MGKPHIQGVVAVWAQEGREELSTFKVRRGGREEIPLIQGKEQRLRFAGAAVKRYPTPKVRETQVFIPIPKKGNAKQCPNYRTVLLISHASKLMLKILQARLQQYVNHELPDVQADFRKGRGTRDQIASLH